MEQLFLLLIGLVLLGARANDDDAPSKCDYTIELIHLQDTSDSFGGAIDYMREVAPQIMGNITQSYPGARISLSTFTDKPITYHGYGPYGGWAYYAYDYCFFEDLALTDSVDDYEDALSRVSIGAGMDFPEDQLESMILAAVNGGFTDGQYNNETERPIVRVVMQVTDATPHMPGDMQEVITNWNMPRNWTTDTGDVWTSYSVGGFGSDQWASQPDVNLQGNYNNSFYHVRPIMYALDHGARLLDLSMSDLAMWQAFIDPVDGMGPEKFRDPEPNPGDGSQYCVRTEYPSINQLGDSLKKQNVVPVMLVADPEKSYNSTLHEICVQQGFDLYGAECLKAVYSGYFDQMDLQVYSVQKLEAGAKNIVESMMAAIDDVMSKTCNTVIASSTKAPSTSTETTPMETTTETRTTAMSTFTITQKMTTTSATTAHDTTASEISSSSGSLIAGSSESTETMSAFLASSSVHSDKEGSTLKSVSSTGMVDGLTTALIEHPTTSLVQTNTDTTSSEKKNGLSTNGLVTDLVTPHLTTGSTITDDDSSAATIIPASDLPIAVIAGATAGAAAALAAAGFFAFKLWTPPPTLEAPPAIQGEVEADQFGLEREANEDITAEAFE